MISSPPDDFDVELLGQRQMRIRQRIADLQAERPTAQPQAERAALARQRLIEAQAAARLAVIGCRDAYLRAAFAHERAAQAHARSAEAGRGVLAVHQESIEVHRAAAEHDRRRAQEITIDRAPAGC